MVKTLVVILGSVLSFCPEPAPNRRNLTAAKAHTNRVIVGKSSLRQPDQSKRQADFTDRLALFFIIHHRNFKNWVPLDDGPTPFSLELIRQLT